MNSPRGALYLLPTPLGDATLDVALPPSTLAIARRLDYLLAENARSARAFVKAIGHPVAVARIRIVEIGHAPDPSRIDDWLAPLLTEGIDAAIVSEAGCPAIADPGANVVARAHDLGIKVRPLVGPSSILLALMGSGMNGQQFRFVGYLPREAAALARRLRELERDSRQGQTQVFIETPYRTDRLLTTIIGVCDPSTRLSIAVDLTTANERVVSQPIRRWIDESPVLTDRPAVFCLLASPALGRDKGVQRARIGRT
jgi:16S rRNA (cytidine1402-2'-O)-methyltransferase